MRRYGLSSAIIDGRSSRTCSMDDMIMVSIDDHMVEPPDMYKNHLPAKWLDQAPKIVRNAQGIDEWTFQGEGTATPFGMAATVGWPRESGASTPARSPSCARAAGHPRAGARHERANGVLASMCFPTMAGFNARTFTEAGDKELSLVMLQAYNDWVLDEWCAEYPGRSSRSASSPCGTSTSRSRSQSASPRRAAGRGQLPRGAARAGFPELPVRPLGPDAAGDVRREHDPVAAHRRRLRPHPEGPRAPIDHLIVLTAQISVLVAQDLLFGPTLRKFPDLKVASSEGGIGWIPFYLDRADRHFQNQAWLDNDFGGKLPSDVFRDHILACYITDPSGLELRHRIGMDIIAWECDYPHTDTTWPVARVRLEGVQDAGLPDDEIHKITWENSCRFFDWDPFKHTPKDQATVGRSAGAGDRRRHHAHVAAEWRKRNEAGPASAPSHRSCALHQRARSCTPICRARMVAARCSGVTRAIPAGNTSASLASGTRSTETCGHSIPPDHRHWSEPERWPVVSSQLCTPGSAAATTNRSTPVVVDHRLVTVEAALRVGPVDGREEAVGERQRERAQVGRELRLRPPAPRRRPARRGLPGTTDRRAHRSPSSRP